MPSLRRALMIVLLALMVAFHIPTEPGGPGPINPADDYCNATYISPYDGTPQAPIGCTIEP